MTPAEIALTIAVAALILGVYVLGRVHDVQRFKGWLTRVEKESKERDVRIEDESKDRDKRLDQRLDDLASSIVHAVDEHMTKPKTYEAIGVAVVQELIRSRTIRREIQYLTGVEVEDKP